MGICLDSKMRCRRGWTVLFLVLFSVYVVSGTFKWDSKDAYSIDSGRNSIKRHLWTRPQQPEAESRFFFPVLAVNPQRSPYNYPQKGYGATYPIPNSYPAPRPPSGSYPAPRPSPGSYPGPRPQPGGSYRPPGGSYGPPKPATGYPASYNPHINEVYITYAPAVQPPVPVNPPGYGGSGASPSGGYLPPAPVEPSYPSYPSPTKPSYPSAKPSYPSSLPAYPSAPTKPSYTTTPAYQPTVQTNYQSTTPAYPKPGYPPVNPPYPPPPVNPGGSYPSGPSGSYPSGPSGLYPSGPSGSYPSGPSGPGIPAPIFVFIPKPGYKVYPAGNKYPPPPRPAPPPPRPNYGVTRPPIPPRPQLPSGVYPPARPRPPSSGYGVPNAAPITYYPPSLDSKSKDSALTSHHEPDHPPAEPIHHPPPSGNLKVPSNDPLGSQSILQSVSQEISPLAPIITSALDRPLPLENLNQTTNLDDDGWQQHPPLLHTFQRGPPSAHHQLQAGLSGLLDLQNRTSGLSFQYKPISINDDFVQNWIDLASTAPSQVAIEALPGPPFRTEPSTAPPSLPGARLPGYPVTGTSPRPNDCGGPWVVLNKPTRDPTKVIVEPIRDPTSVVVEPIRPGSSVLSAVTSGGVRWTASPGGSSSVAPIQIGFADSTGPPFFNDFLNQINLGRLAPPPTTAPPQTTAPPTFQQLPEVLIFATTPPDEDGWRKPNLTRFLIRPALPNRFDSATGSGRNTDSLRAFKPSPSIDESQLLFNTPTADLETFLGFQEPDVAEEGSPFLVIPNNPVAEDSFVAASQSVKTSDNDINGGVKGQNNSTAIGTNRSSSTIIDQLNAANLRIIATFLSQTEIASLIQDKNYTLIAPSNSAFNRVPSSIRQQWTSRPDVLREMVLYHLVTGHLPVSSFRNELTPITLAGSRRLRINIYNKTDDDEVVTINGAKVVTPGLRIGNLVVHVVDRVLFPSTQLSILDILNAGGMLDSLQATILGPNLSSLLASDETPMTVFIPTTDAFLKITEDDQLLLLNETAFHDLLRYHVVPGTFYSEGLEDNQRLSTLNGNGTIQVNLRRRNRKNQLHKINGIVNVIRSDISATNGVVHFIDQVLTNISS